MKTCFLLLFFFFFIGRCARLISSGNRAAVGGALWLLPVLRRGHGGGGMDRCRPALSPGSFFLFFSAPPPSLVRLVLQWTSPFFSPLLPPFFSRPLPQLWKWTPRYGYEGEDEVCSKFPALLARQPPGWLPANILQVLSSQPEFLSAIT